MARRRGSYGSEKGRRENKERRNNPHLRFISVVFSGSNFERNFRQFDVLVAKLVPKESVNANTRSAKIHFL
jgi:hypothetical protein